MVHAKLFHQPDALLDGFGVGSSTQSAEGVVIGISLQKHLPSVQLQTEVRAELNAAYAKRLTGLVGGSAVFTQQLSLYGIQIRCVEVPHLWVTDFNISCNALFLMTGHLVALQGNGLVVDRFTFW